MEKLGVVGYLMILVGIFLINLSMFFSVCVLIGGFLVALAWIKLGKRSKDKAMLGNGIFIIVLPIIAFTVTLLSIVLRNFVLLSYGIFFVVLICMVSFVFDLLSHLNAYRKFNIKSFAFAFGLRIVGFVISVSILVDVSGKLLRVSNLTGLVDTLKSSSIELSIAALVVIVANLLSAHGFYKVPNS